MYITFLNINLAKELKNLKTLIQTQQLSQVGTARSL